MVTLKFNQNRSINNIVLQHYIRLLSYSTKVQIKISQFLKSRMKSEHHGSMNIIINLKWISEDIKNNKNMTKINNFNNRNKKLAEEHQLTRKRNVEKDYNYFKTTSYKMKISMLILRENKKNHKFKCKCRSS